MAVQRIEELTRDRERVGIEHDDADDTIGTIASDDAIGFDPLPLLRSFDHHGVRVVVIGQVAGILHGSSELTGDLDLLWSGDPADAPAMAAAVSAVGADLFDDDQRPLATGPAAFERPKVQFRAPTAAGDCCTPALPWGGLDLVAFFDRADSCTVDGAEIHFLSLPDLNATRLAVGRPKDLRRVAEFENPDTHQGV
ncbi:MAG: hypothetical protein GY773_05365 [Actinomycetia bacterium]|nr:hypothetical protein [Actinomycetes bacterium]